MAAHAPHHLESISTFTYTSNWGIFMAFWMLLGFSTFSLLVIVCWLARILCCVVLWICVVHWFDLLYHMMVLCLHVCEATRYMCKTNIHIFSYFPRNLFRCPKHVFECHSVVEINSVRKLTMNCANCSCVVRWERVVSRSVSFIWK